MPRAVTSYVQLGSKYQSGTEKTWLIQHLVGIKLMFQCRKGAGKEELLASLSLYRECSLPDAEENTQRIMPLFGNCVFIRAYRISFTILKICL